jgi:hypothetical protein
VTKIYYLEVLRASEGTSPGCISVVSTGRRPDVKVVAKSFSQHVVPTPPHPSMIRLGKRERKICHFIEISCVERLTWTSSLNIPLVRWRSEDDSCRDPWGRPMPSRGRYPAYMMFMGVITYFTFRTFNSTRKKKKKHLKSIITKEYFSYVFLFWLIHGCNGNKILNYIITNNGYIYPLSQIDVGIHENISATILYQLQREG